MASPSTIFLAAFISILAFGLLGVDAAKDLTRIRDAKGADVVQAVISQIEVSGFFEDDHRILRRIAYVETKDGANIPPFRGGIWALGRKKFEKVLNASVLAELRSETEEKWSFSWSRMTWEEDLRYPFYSGLAARLYLSLLEIRQTASIPLSGSIPQQASFWFTYYHTKDGSLNEQNFIDRVSNLTADEGNIRQLYNHILVAKLGPNANWGRAALMSTLAIIL